MAMLGNCLSFLVRDFCNISGLNFQEFGRQHKYFSRQKFVASRASYISTKESVCVCVCVCVCGGGGGGSAVLD